MTSNKSVLHKRFMFFRTGRSRIKMKIFSIVILLISMLVNSGNGQEYKPFDFDKGTWYCRYLTKGGMFGGQHGTYYATDSVKFFCNGDTLINYVLFKKLFYEGYSSSQYVPSTNIGGYYGAIRNDTLNKKVYFLSGGWDPDYEMTEILLYNFDLQVGDSIKISCLNPDEITHIDSVLYCNQYHRRYNTSTGEHLIEGIGSEYGFFPLNCPLASGWLICYQELENTECDDCNPFTLSSVIYSEQFNIYPNPTTGFLQIEPVQDIESLQIFNIHGKLVAEHTNDFERMILKDKGMYILKIKSRNKYFSYKVVKE
jgi:hypothetical protein